MTDPSMTIEEYLSDTENSLRVVEKLVAYLEEKGEWERRGLYADLAADIGFSAAYVGRVLAGKQKITRVFLAAFANTYNLDMCRFLGATVTIPGLRCEELKAEMITIDESTKRDASDFDKVMGCLRRMQLPHGLCKPRERKACTVCNAKDELDRMVEAYSGRIVKLS